LRAASRSIAVHTSLCVSIRIGLAQACGRGGR
jgi:hypothetical protein